MAGFELIATEPLTLARQNRLADMYVLSPFVWREGKVFHVLLRAVPRRDDAPRLKMAEIWHGVSDDGLHFRMEAAPVIFPGPGLADLDGCEDPTVLRTKDRIRVWYTGWNHEQETGRLLLARGPDLEHIAKAGVVLESQPPFANPKEPSVVPIRGGGWRMFFEYAHEEASLVGQTVSDSEDGPWSDLAQAQLRPRKGQWDDWHLSPGPIIDADTDRPIMFFNGAGRSADWRIGWAAFDPAFEKMTDRSDDPLITPEKHGEMESDIAFAASALEEGEEIWLYFSQSDQSLRRARIKRC